VELTEKFVIIFERAETFMKKDRFLIGILVGIGVLAVVAVGLFFLRQKQVDYVPDDTPQGVVQDYALALYKQDYQRAYSYLAEGEGKPDLARFQQVFITSQKTEFDRVGLKLGEVSVTGDNAGVSITLIHASGDPFQGSYRDIQSVTLKKQATGWKLTNMPYPFWEYSWYQPEIKK
jgi:hypothetical protein